MIRCARLFAPAWAIVVLATGFGCSDSGSSDGSGGVRAYQLEAGDPIPTGPAATGTVGDYVLENGLVRFVIQGPTFINQRDRGNCSKVSLLTILALGLVFMVFF